MGRDTYTKTHLRRYQHSHPSRGRGSAPKVFLGHTAPFGSEQHAAIVAALGAVSKTKFLSNMFKSDTGVKTLGVFSGVCPLCNQSLGSGERIRFAECRLRTETHVIALHTACGRDYHSNFSASHKHKRVYANCLVDGCCAQLPESGTELDPVPSQLVAAWSAVGIKPPRGRKTAGKSFPNSKATGRVKTKKRCQPKKETEHAGAVCENVLIGGVCGRPIVGDDAVLCPRCKRLEAERKPYVSVSSECLDSTSDTGVDVSTDVKSNDSIGESNVESPVAVSDVASDLTCSTLISDETFDMELEPTLCCSALQSENVGCKDVTCDDSPLSESQLEDVGCEEVCCGDAPLSDDEFQRRSSSPESFRLASDTLDWETPLPMGPPPPPHFPQSFDLGFNFSPQQRSTVAGVGDNSSDSTTLRWLVAYHKTLLNLHFAVNERERRVATRERCVSLREEAALTLERQTQKTLSGPFFDTLMTRH